MQKHKDKNTKKTSRRITVFMLVVLATPLLLSSLTAASTATYTYDTQHRLGKAEYDDGTAIEYSYDALGNRTSLSRAPATSTVYEDAEDKSTNRLLIYDADPAGATITNVFDSERNSRVIECSGSATDNGYRLHNADGSNWNNTNATVMQWSMKFNENYMIYIRVQTTNGLRYLTYKPTTAISSINNTYLYHSLGTKTRNGAWHTITRDLNADLKMLEPDNALVSILHFLIRGSGRIDDIMAR